MNQRMRRDWDLRAQQNAMYFIDTRREAWDAESFFREGRAEAIALVAPMLDRLDFDPRGRRLLEIGCGIGRLFPGFADLFAEVWGIDVSAEMVRQGRALCPVPHARFVLGSGADLQGIEESSVDYCFSYIVFQHIPEIRVLWRYLADVRRVLRPGGAFQLHFRADRPLRSRLLLRLPLSARAAIMRLRRRPLPGDTSTWTGAAVAPRRAVARLAGLGFEHIQVVPCHTFSHQSFWVIGRKPVETVP
jgi:ubiquinone/menaquinone biosynthesis C-methylase UbiE